MILNKLNINTIDDLVNYYPYRFDRLQKTDLNDNYSVVIRNGVISTAHIPSFSQIVITHKNIRIFCENPHRESGYVIQLI